MTEPSRRRESARAADPHAHGPGHGQVRSEDDKVASFPIIAVGVASLVVFFLASWVTIGYLRAREAERPTPPTPPEIGSSKIALVEQQLFELADRGERDRAARQQRLGGYGWVDRKAGVVHFPIERAMELSLQGVRTPTAGGATPGGQP
jgi:hypothetical protein